MTDMTCDVAIIGAGTAGLAAERAARKAGAKTLLIDDRFAGTTCTTVGCMPSKLLIAAGNAAHGVRNASMFGIRAGTPEIDGKAVMARLQRERDAFVAATLKSIDAIPPHIRVQQRAHFTGRTTLQLGDGRTVHAKAVVVATGSRPHVPDMFKPLGDRVLTNETVFELSTLPQSLAVIGAGPLGLELAQGFARLGVATEVFEQSDHLAALHDADVAKELRSILEREFPIHSGVKLNVAKCEQTAEISWSGPSSGSKSFEYVLVATGRPPALHDLNLAAAGIVVDEHGLPHIDDATMQCGDAPIFFAGDADGQRPVLHEAASEGFLAGRNAAAYPKIQRGKRNVALSIMFTSPSLAMIGAPPADATIVGSASYADQGRAKVEGRNAGLIRLYAAKDTGRLTGAVLLGPGMDHIAHLIAWGIERGETAATMLALPFYHPTFEEGLKPALRQICKAANADGLDPFDEIASPGA